MSKNKRKRGGFGAFSGRDAVHGAGEPARGFGAFSGRDAAEEPVAAGQAMPDDTAGLADAADAEPNAGQHANRADKTTVLPFRKQPIVRTPLPLAQLYARFDEMAEGRKVASGEWSMHEAILDRLAANMREASSQGWTSCALERRGGMGRLQAFGVRPSDSSRRLIPDWPFELRS